MPKKEYYRRLFLIGAWWNWFASIPFFFIYKHIFAILDMRPPQPALWFYLFLGAVFLFGIGYYLVSRDITRNHGLVILGVLGKAGVFLCFMVSFFRGDIHFLLLIMGTIDFIFGVLFVEFLMQRKKLFSS